MKTKTVAMLTFALASMPFGPLARGADAQPAEHGTTYANLQGQVLLDNRRVIVHQFVVEPGQSTGRRAPQGDQLLVYIRGGILKSNDTGRSTLWRDGRVAWWSATDPPDGGSTNVGTTLSGGSGDIQAGRMRRRETWFQASSTSTNTSTTQTFPVRTSWRTIW